MTDYNANFFNFTLEQATQDGMSAAFMGYSPEQATQDGMTAAFMGYSLEQASLGGVAPAADTTPPTAPGTPTFSRTGRQAVDVTYTAGTDETTATGNLVYEIHWDNVAAQAFQARRVSAAGTLTTNIQDLPVNETLYFKVRTRDQAGNVSSASSEASYTLTDNPPTFAGITTLTATATSMTAGWAAASDDYAALYEIQYEVHYSTTAAAPFRARFVTDFASTSAVITNLAAGTYYVRVRAKDNYGHTSTDGGAEMSVVVTGVVNTVPTFGGIVSATAASGSSIDLAWAAATDTESASNLLVYEIHYAKTASATFAPRAVTSAGATTFTVTDLYPGTTYYFRVKARDPAGGLSTDGGIEVSATTPIPVAGAAGSPVVTNQNPAPETEITPKQAISFDVTDTSTIRRVIVTASNGTTEEVVHDGENFVAPYAGPSVQTVISGGYNYKILRVGGWSVAPTIRVYAFDLEGNEA